jgi:3-oxoadipate enol-lactonase
MPIGLSPPQAIDAPAGDGELAGTEGSTFVRAGCTIHYWTTGGGGAPAVVLTHGLTVDHGTFAAQVPAVRDSGYRVLTWDLRGHGLSQPAGDRFTVRAAAEDLAGLLDEARVDDAVLVGQSFGGLVIQELYRHQPHRVRGLVLVGSTSLGEQFPWHQRLLARARPFLLRLWPEGHLRRVTPAFLSRREDVQAYIAQAIRPLSKADLVAMTEAALDGLLDYEPLDTITTPVLLVRGQDELAIVAKTMHAWADRDAQIRLEVVPDAGHLVNQENAERFNEVLLDFLASTRPTDRSGGGTA